MMDNIPKNILEIEDLVFILPDDFKGTIKDALEYMLEYTKNTENVNQASILRAGNEPSVYTLIESNFQKRAAFKYTIHHLDTESNKYIPLDSIE